MTTALRPEVAAWKWVDAPATTIAGDPRITAREHHFHGEQSKTSLRLTLHEASILQTFPVAHTRTEAAMSAKPTAHIKALDLFAGTGWGVACKRLGIKEAGVEIMPEAVATRTANGMETIYNDVWDGLNLTAEQHREQYGSYGLLIASPPCQTFSLAGKGAGRAALDEVLEAIELHAYKDADALKAFGAAHDMRTALVLSPLAYVWRDRPRLVAMEQVPTVLPVWQACAEVMREWGYDVKVEVLNAEQYGVPQTRKRAILVARRGGPVNMPTPTHSRYYSRTPDKLDPGVKKWVSMAEALGWEVQPGEVTVRTSMGAPKVDDRNGSHTLDPAIRPMHTLTSKSGSVTISGRGLTDRPSPTITGGGTEAGGAEPIAKFHERYTSAPGWVGATDRLTTDEAAALQSYPTEAVKNMGRGMVERYGDRPGRLVDDPSFTVRASAGGTEPGGFVFKNEDGTTRKAEASEVSALQSYEPPFIWCGTKTKQFLQIGNAVPPLLAEHILAALIGINTTIQDQP